MNLFVIIIL